MIFIPVIIPPDTKKLRGEKKATKKKLNLKKEKRKEESIH
jgi:hypothetical protein